MADVDLAVRYLNFACTDEYNNLKENKKIEIIENFQKIPKNNIPNYFRNLDTKKLTKWFFTINSNISKAFTDFFKKEIKEIKSDSNSNFEGSDLIVVFKDKTTRNIELKFGSETLRQFGLHSMDLMFPISNHDDYFVKIFKIVKDNQVKYAKTNIGDEEGLIKQLRAQLLTISEELNNFKNNKLININSAEIEQQLSGTGSSTRHSGALHPEKFVVSDKKIVHKPFEDYSGAWKLESIGVSEQEGKARLEIWILNKTLKVKYLLNWKNNKTICGFSYRSVTGVNSYCFNVWSYKI